MGRYIFQNRISFSVFVWLAVTFSIISNYGTFANSLISLQNSFGQTTSRFYSIIDPINEAAATIISQASAKDIPQAVVPSNDLQCMAENIYYEAATQSYAGKIAVGQVVLNRVKKPGYPNTVCGVIYEGSQNVKTTACQFSWTCAEHKGIDKTGIYWSQSLTAAKDLLTKRDSLVDITEGATSYHANYVNPQWSKQLHFVAQIDQHLFYRSTK